MAKVLTSEQKNAIKKIVFEKANNFGYVASSRYDSGRFMDELVDDIEVGGILKQYMPKERIRTYIKDGILNAYKKELVKKALADTSPTDIIQSVYGIQSSVIQECTGKNTGVSVSCSDDGRIFVISGGTVLKWETALRKALELISRQPKLLTNNTALSICLHLVAGNKDLTDGDKKHIIDALTAVGIEVLFYSE
ncbi:MAG: hypothetical protein LBU83_02805 [Bacteroidales bacterium]|jgi:hypothetical protein|nr:hypothetical protein [Bacteroidales bacterium]